jgi:hypothetical protein
MAFPIDEKGMFNIFTDFEFVKPHKGAVVFLDCERVLIQYEKNTGPLSPGFIVSLRTEVGETYVLETKGFLHEGKRAFVYGEAKGLTGSVGPTGPTGPNLPTSSTLGAEAEGSEVFATPSNNNITAVQREPDLFGSDVQRIPTILGFLERSKSLATQAESNTSNALSQTLGTAKVRDTAVGSGSGVDGSSRLIPRDFFFKTCEESCFKICFTATTHCTQVGILFFNNTEDYCLSLTQFLVFRSTKPGCCPNRTSCCVPGNCVACDNNHEFSKGYAGSSASQYPEGKGYLVKDPCSPCNPYNSCNSNYIWASDCCKENICIKTGPTGAPGPIGATGAPGVAGTRTFALNISRQGFAGSTLPSLNCSVLGTFFLETGVTPNQIAGAFTKCSGSEMVFSNCVKLWQCNGSTFQWIIPSPADYIYYDMDGLYLWIIQNQTATLLRSNPGDLVVDSNTGNVLVGNSSGQWIFDGTNLKGPTGPLGPIGPTGPMGNPGIQGPVGPTGVVIGSATFITDISPADFVLIANNQGSLINFVPISLDASSIPTGTISTSTFLNNFSSQRKLEIDMTINNILFAASVVSSEIGPGQHVSGVLTIDLSTYLINQGFFPAFIGNPSIVAQVQQDDVAINVGYPNNVYSSLANGQNQVRLVIVYYNAEPSIVDLLSFQTLINLSVKICGKVSVTA